MSENRNKPCTLSTLLHTTVIDGVLVEVSKELLIEGPMELHMNGVKIGELTELRLDNVLWKQPTEGT